MSLPRLDELGSQADPATFGRKAAGLGLAIDLGLRVPPGFVLPASMATDEALLAQGVQALGLAVGCRLGDSERPLVLSVRASGPRSLPGQLDTVLGLGATKDALAALSERLGARAPALSLVHHVRTEVAALEAEPRHRRKVEDLEAAVAEGIDVPADIATLAAIIRRIRDRATRHLPEPIAVVVQVMVFGSHVGASGSCVAHSRHPITGAPGPNGEWSEGMLGAELTGGRVTPNALSAAERPRSKDLSLELMHPTAFAEVARVLAILEGAFRAPVEVEITLESGTVHVLQVRASTLGPIASVTANVALVLSGAITEDEAIARIDLSTLRQAGASELPDEQALRRSGVREVGRGLVASLGVASGRMYIRPEDAMEASTKGPVILVRGDASPEDAPAVRAAAGVATASGGLTSHAAVMSRALGRPCAVSISNLRIDEAGGAVIAGSTTLKVGDWVTVDGNVGRLLQGQASPRWVARAPAATTLLGWAQTRAGVADSEPGEWYEQLRLSRSPSPATTG